MAGVGEAVDGGVGEAVLPLAKVVRGETKILFAPEEHCGVVFEYMEVVVD